MALFGTKDLGKPIRSSTILLSKENSLHFFKMYKAKPFWDQ